MKSFQRGIEARYLLQWRISESLGLLGIGVALVSHSSRQHSSPIWGLSADTLKGARAVPGFVFLAGALVRVVPAVHSRLVNIPEHNGVDQRVEAIRFKRDFPTSS